MRGVLVHQPLAVGQVDAVHRAVGAFALQARCRCRAQELAPVEDECDANALRRDVRLQVGDVVRLRRTRADRCVVDDGALAHHDFGHGVGEVARPPRR